jgi:branched-chain amino acid transport system substrate-binding protein
VAIPNHIIVITPTSSDPSLSFIKGRDYLVWRVYPSDTLQGAVLAQAMGKAFGTHAVINVGARNDAFGAALAAEFEKDWKAHGGKIGRVVLYNPNATTFDADAQKLAAGHPAGWMIADFPPTFAKMGPALVRTGLWAPTRTFMTEVMEDDPALNKIGAPATNGLRGTASVAAKGAGVKAFEALFKKSYSKVPSTGFEGTSFDAVVLAFLAALAADSSDPTLIKQHLQAVSAPPGRAFIWQQLPQAIKAIVAGHDINYQGAWGPIDWDSRGDPPTAVYVIWKHEHGQITILRTITFRR